MITYEQLMELLTNRRSIRYFSDEPIDKNTLTHILEAGRIAPSVENIQPWHLYVVTEKALKEKLMQASCYGNFVAGASVFIVIACDRSAAAKAPNTLWNPREMEYSCALVSYNMMLAATSLGIGSCWVSLHHGPAHDALKLKDHQIVIGGLMLGHMKKEDAGASEEHQRRDLESIVTFKA